jgi:hypothetical protein
MSKNQDTSSNNTGPGVGTPPSKARNPMKGGVVGSMGDRKSGQPNPTGKRGNQG